MIESREYIVKVKQLGIKPSDIVEYMSEENNDIAEFFIELATNELKKIETEEVHMAYRIFSAELHDKKFNINNINFEIGAEVSDALKNIDSVAIFACTVGAELDSKLSRYNQTDQMTEAYIADVVGTVMVEKCVSLIVKQLQTDLNEYSLKTTNTISPGNCGWDIREQEKLFGLLPDNYMGITLNKYGMMHPVKSLSGIVGIGEWVKFKHTNCQQCASKNCLYRKAAYNLTTEIRKLQKKVKLEVQ